MILSKLAYLKGQIKLYSLCILYMFNLGNSGKDSGENIKNREFFSYDLSVKKSEKEESKQVGPGGEKGLELVLRSRERKECLVWHIYLSGKPSTTSY